ncbi:MAG: SHOCT domain-containing protein [Ornithinibacter sp.]
MASRGWGWDRGQLVVVGLIVLVVVFAVGGLGHDRSRTVAGTSPPATGSPTAQQILEARFASSDLSEEEYRHRREVLHGG